MSTFERTLTVEAAPQLVFDFVSDPENMPAYLPHIESAELLPDGKLRLRRMVNGQEHVERGFFRVIGPEHRMEWGADGDHAYHGSLRVREGDVTLNIAEVDMKLEFGKHGPPGEAVLEEMEQTLENIRNRVKKSGSANRS